MNMAHVKYGSKANMVQISKKKTFYNLTKHAHGNWIKQVNLIDQKSRIKGWSFISFQGIFQRLTKQLRAKHIN